MTDVFIPGLAEREWETDIQQGNADVDVERWKDTGHGILRITTERAQRMQIRIHLQSACHVPDGMDE